MRIWLEEGIGETLNACKCKKPEDQTQGGDEVEMIDINNNTENLAHASDEPLQQMASKGRQYEYKGDSECEHCKSLQSMFEESSSKAREIAWTHRVSASFIFGLQCKSMVVTDMPQRAER
jgi:hypothetical protein